MAITRYLQGSVEVVQLEERLTADEVEIARPIVHRAVQNRLPQLIIDLRKLLLVDSAGLELLVETSNECVRKGGELRLAGASPLIKDVLRITGLDRQLSIDHDVVVAAGVFAR
jgi:anti-anti-sigma factor